MPYKIGQILPLKICRQIKWTFSIFVTGSLGECKSWYTRFIILQCMEHLTMKCCLELRRHPSQISRNNVFSNCQAWCQTRGFYSEQVNQPSNTMDIMPLQSFNLINHEWAWKHQKNILLSRYREDANQNSKCMIAEKHLNDKIRRRLSRTRKLWSNPRITRF
jgi:hypothetical protein